jgi:hypothetical protein
MTEYRYDHDYQVKVHDVLRGALCDATPGGWDCVRAHEAVDALIRLAVNILIGTRGDAEFALEGLEPLHDRIHELIDSKSEREESVA